MWIDHGYIAANIGMHNNLRNEKYILHSAKMQLNLQCYPSPLTVILNSVDNHARLLLTVG